MAGRVDAVVAGVGGEVPVHPQDGDLAALRLRVDAAQRSEHLLGGESALLRLARAARARGLGLIADIVPNHMAAHPSNAWWRDVLAHGPASAWSRHFDIDWDPPAPTLKGKVLLPVLGDHYGV